MIHNELNQLADELAQINMDIVICTCNKPNAMTYSEFLRLKEILKSKGSKIILTYDTNLMT
jgi:hypothetical protein